MIPECRFSRGPGLRMLAAGLLLLAGVAQAGLFPTYPTGSGPGVWEIDRYPPAGFSNAGSVNGRPNALAIELSAADGPTSRPPNFSEAYYNTQGRGMQHDNAAYSVIYGSVYIPAAWATTNPGDATLNHRTELWGVLSPPTGGDSCPASACNLFPIVGFSNASPTDPLGAGGAGRMRVWDTNVGFVDLPVPVAYDQWSDVCIAFTGSELRYYVGGAQVHLQTNLQQDDSSFGPPTKWTRSIMQAYNFGSAYTSHWAGIGAGRLQTTSLNGGDNQSAATNAAFAAPLAVVARDTGGAPLPCIPVTFAAPGSGASANLSGVTVLTDRNGVASVTATANGTPGAYVVTATAPGLAATDFHLTNLGLPAAVTATGGGGQSTTVTTSFALPLRATVRDGGGAPVAGASVTFTLPASGASGTFPGNVLSATETTNASGVATSPIVTANATVGSFAASAVVAGVAAPATFTLTNTLRNATLAKAFAPATIASGEKASLTLTLANPNPVPLTLALMFTDAMPAGLRTSGPGSGTCQGVSVTSTQVVLPAGASIPAGGCTIVVSVTSSTPGTVVNTTSALVTQAGTAAAASASLTVTGAVSSVSLAKRFAPASIVQGGTATLTLTFGNSGSTPAVLSAGFADAMPAGLVTRGSNTGTCAGATVTADTIAMPAGAAIPVGGCTIVVAVTSDTAGTFTNTTSALATEAGSAPAASAQLTVAGLVLAATGGGEQVTRVGTSFGSPLVATVTTLAAGKRGDASAVAAAGIPVPGVPVTFTLPSTGPSGSFTGGGLVAVVVTDADGVATSPLVIANGVAGRYAATASVAAVAGVTYSLVNEPDVPIATQPVPTLGEFALLLLAILVAASSASVLRRRG